MTANFFHVHLVIHHDHLLNFLISLWIIQSLNTTDISYFSFVAGVCNTKSKSTVTPFIFLFGKKLRRTANGEWRLGIHGWSGKLLININQITSFLYNKQDFIISLFCFLHVPFACSMYLWTCCLLQANKNSTAHLFLSVL